jgi:hypothetical protein
MLPFSVRQREELFAKFLPLPRTKGRVSEPDHPSLANGSLPFFGPTLNTSQAFVAKFS